MDLIGVKSQIEELQNIAAYLERAFGANSITERIRRTADDLHIMTQGYVKQIQQS